MRLARLVAHVVLSMTVMVLSLADANATEAATDLIPATVVLRGSAPAASEEPPVSVDDPTILRGSTPAAVQPHPPPYGCAPGLAFDPSYGCVLPGYASTADYGDWTDNGFWPNYGFDGTDGGWHRGLRHRFARANHRASAFGLRHRNRNGFGRGFAHSVGFGHR
jgi:hypothetical protein